MDMISSRTVGRIVITSVAYFVLVFIAMHFLEPEFSPIRAPGSAYVLGAYGSLMTTGYFAQCVAWLGVGYGLLATVRGTRLTRIACVVALIVCAGILLAASFPMDYPPPLRTTSGRLHALGGGLAFPGMILASSLFTLSIRQDGEWKRVAGVVSGLSVGIVAAFVVTISSMLVLGFGGYAQRVLMAVLSAWMIVIGLHLTRLPRSA